MAIPTEFKETIQTGNTFKGGSIVLGSALLGGETSPDLWVKVPLRTMNRHGLICGATGTGKTKTLQLITEQLSLQGVPVLLMDIKGDLSGLAAPGTMNDFIRSRHERMGVPYEPQGLPVELLTISKEPGARLRATISEFGPVLLGRILELNDTQSSILSLVFKYCDDNRLPLVDVKDLRSVLQHISGEGRKEIQRTYGQISGASVSTIIRKLVELEQQGGDGFFGEPSFAVQDLLSSSEGKGVVHILRLTDVQDRPRLFSTFMLCLLAEIYATFPEVGDQDKPKLVLFIDEAHLIFDNATKPLLDQIESIVRLIRSKGVGVYFCTQDPSDVPDRILGQLGLKVQHALRAFTAKDRTTIRRTAQNYPLSPFYDTEQLITSMGIGEALVTALGEKGAPTPLAHTMLRAPISRMDILSPLEIEGVISRSALAPKYNRVLDTESAHEILERKLEEAREGAPGPVTDVPQRPVSRSRRMTTGEAVQRQVANTLVRELTRGLLGVLGLRSTGRRR